MSTIKPWRAVRLVAKREVNTRLKTRSFVIGTGVLLLLLLGFVGLQSFIANATGTSTIGLSGQSAGIAEQLKAVAAQSGGKLVTVPISSPEEGRAKVQNGDIDALLSGNVADLHVLVKSTLDQKLRLALDRVSQQEVLNAKLSEAGLDPAQVMSAVAATQVAVTSIQPVDPERGQRLAIGLIVAILLYISIVTYGALAAQGVVEEKSSRVVEILLSTVRPWHLLLGKVIGLGLVGLAQLAILAGVGLIGASATGVLTLSGVAAGTLVWGLVWYLLGFFLYATIFGAAGSLVSRQEEAQSVVAPVSITLMIGFVVGINLMIQAPDGQATRILSLIPLLSPILMPGRIAAGTVGTWEVTLSLALTLATIGLFTWLGGKIYQNAVLRTGSRVKLTEALHG